MTESLAFHAQSPSTANVSCDTLPPAASRRKPDECHVLPPCGGETLTAALTVARTAVSKDVMSWQEVKKHRARLLYFTVVEQRSERRRKGR